MNEEIYQLFHILWTKAVGTEGYDKKQWRHMEDLLERFTVEPSEPRVTPTTPTVPPRSK